MASSGPDRSHVQLAALLNLHLADFFPPLRFPRVAAFFRTAGYPQPVADALTIRAYRLSGLARWASLRDPGYANGLAFSGPA